MSAEESRKDIYDLAPDDDHPARHEQTRSGDHQEHDPPREEHANDAQPVDDQPPNDPHTEDGAVDAGDDELWKPILIEGEDVTECPKCGAPMPEQNQVVCIRCGFDLNQMTEVETETGAVELNETEQQREQQPPLARPERGGMHLPAILTGVAAMIMAIAYLAGVAGLYPSTDAPDFLPRVGHLFRFYFLALCFAGSIMLGLLFYCRIERRTLGDHTLAMIRALSIAMAPSIVMIFVPASWYTIFEFGLESLIIVVIFIAMIRFYFAVTWREAGVLGGCAIFFYGGIYLFGKLLGLIFGGA